MHVNRGLVFWGLALVTAGAVALLIQSGNIDAAAAREAWRYWPIVLILIGLAIIASRTPFAVLATAVAGIAVGGLAGSLAAGWPQAIGFGCGGDPTETLTEEGAFSDTADVDLRFNCGSLEVSMVDGSEWALEARHGPDRAPQITSNAGALSVNANRRGGPFGFSETRQEWDLELPRQVELDLSVDVNAAGSTLDLSGGSFSGLRLNANAGSLTADLSGATVVDLAVDMNAGSVSLVADGDTSLAGTLGVNAGSVELCAPDGVGVEIELDDPNVTFSHNLDDRGFDESGDTWRLGSGTPAIRLEVDGNAASFSFNPDGGCE